MPTQSFSLQPFRTSQPLPLQLTGSITRQAHSLSLRYQLQGDLTTVLLPDPAPTPLRQDNLWTTTCFECFLGHQRSPQYWEFNLSPAGHWNVYRFADYRQGMQIETALTELPFQVQTHPEAIWLSLELNGVPLGLSLAPSEMAVAPLGLELGITAVVQLQDGTLTYWALTHPGPEPDFHRRDSFVLVI